LLFQRLYNWIKYKTLPPSFLFKNRLFIERDSKHRRILSNFGLSFRNSKWTNYETYNIKTQFKKNYFKYIYWIFIFVTFIGFIFSFKNYYILSYFFNNISFFFWISLDTFDYYFSFLIWVLTTALSLISNLIYSYFFINIFTSKPHPLETFANYSSKNNFSSKNLYTSKHDLNWFLYSWLTSDKCKTKAVFLEDIFNTNLNSNWWKKNYDFFIKLYKIVFFLNLSSEKNSRFYLTLKLNQINNTFFKGSINDFLYFFNNTNTLTNYSSLLLSYFLNNYKIYFDEKNNKSSSLVFLKKNTEWNLHNLNTEINKYAFLLKTKSGLFDLNDLNYQKLSNFIFNFPELWSLNFFLKNQSNVAKWNRWLYRYSILHRKILKNSHKITLSKKLINSGVYDTKVFNKNIWASEHLSKINLNNQFTSFFTLYYDNLFHQNYNNLIHSKINTSNNGTKLNSLKLLNFFEDSYFWYLKRFYNFNSLCTNLIKSQLKLNFKINNINNVFIDKKNTNDKYTVLLNYLLNCSYINLNLFSHINYSYLNTNSFFNNTKTILNNNKDLYLLNNENDVLSKDNLNILYSIVTNFSKSNNILFFNYLNEKVTTDFNYSSHFINKNFNDVYNINYWMIFSLINFDKFFLTDLTYLSLFN
jgi:hypothetical protein